MTDSQPIRSLAEEERQERIAAERADPNTAQIAKIAVDKIRARGSQDADNLRLAQLKSSGFPEDD